MKINRMKLFVNGMLFVSILSTLYTVQLIEYNIFFHILSGVLTVLFLTLHVLMKKGWLVHATKALKAGKMGDKTKAFYILNILLFKVWIFAIVAGIVTLLYNINILTNFNVAGELHSVLILFALSLTVLHLIFNLIRFFTFKRKNLKS